MSYLLSAAKFAGRISFLPFTTVEARPNEPMVMNVNSKYRDGTITLLADASVVASLIQR